MKDLFLLLTFLLGLSVSAQGTVDDYISLNEELQKIGHEEVTKDELAGTPFWNDEFVPGVIRRNGKKEIEGYFRYDILNDQVQIKIQPEDTKYYFLPRWGDLEYQTENYSFFLSHKVTAEKKSLYGFFINYFESEIIKFYGKPLVEVLPAQKAETSYDKGRPATIKIKSHYYIQYNDEPLIEVKIRERDFRKLFNNSKQMRAYFKENKIKDIEDVVHMLKFFENQ